MICQGQFFRILPDNLKQAISKCPPIIAVSPNGWSRFLPGLYFPNFKMIVYRNRQDVDSLRKIAFEVLSLQEKKEYLEIETIAASAFLGSPLAKQFVDSQPNRPALLVYKSSSALEEIAEKNKWKIIGNSLEIRDQYENKRIFKEILHNLRLTEITGENLEIKDLNTAKLIELQKKYGQKLVFQFTDCVLGGGVGTLFINSYRDLPLLLKRQADLQRRHLDVPINRINVATYITGVSASIAACATHKGILTGPVQTQLIDIENVNGREKGRNGNFCGHDWSWKHYNQDIQKQADNITKIFGEYIYHEGYRGIFGLDLLVDSNQKVWPVECNPRYTGAFPMLSMMMAKRGVIPMDIYHVLELLKIKYDFDFEKQNKEYKNRLNGSQIILFNKNSWSQNHNCFKAGVYTFNKKNLNYLRDGYSYLDLKNNDEVLITEGITNKSIECYQPRERLGRLVSQNSMITSPTQVKRRTKLIIEACYRQFGLTIVNPGLSDRAGLKIGRIQNISDYRQSDWKEYADVVEVVKQLKTGYYLPSIISWRKEIKQEPIDKQIYAEYLKKQLRVVRKAVKNKEIKVSVVDNLNQSLFDEWYKLYRQHKTTKGEGRVVIEPDWLNLQILSGKRIGAIMVWQNNKIIAGSMVNFMTKRLSIDYQAVALSRQRSKNLVLLLDYYGMQLAKKRNYTYISLGQETNLYGYHLSTNRIKYKYDLGFRPQPAYKADWVTLFINKPAKFDDPIMFWGDDHDKLRLYVISRKQNIGDYLPETIDNYKMCKAISLA